MTREHIHFVTGRLAEFSLRKVVAEIQPRVDFQYSIGVLGISVAALMTVEWVRRKLTVPAEATRVILPGHCRGDTAELEELWKVPVQKGPKDLRDLDLFFGGKKEDKEYGRHDIQILAEINHAPRMSLEEILQQAKAFSADGADLIDLGCEPGSVWRDVGEIVARLRDEGFRVSIDSLEPQEIALAVRAGAELVLSVNSSNRQAALDWGCEVVAIPDDPAGLIGLDETVEFLALSGVPLRIDPILEPIGFGFAESLGRYLEIRRRYPDAEMLMGIGNLTELTDVDSAGINVLLLGFCQELGIRSVLTTQVIPWARSSVKECDLARKLVYHAVKQHTLPKHLDTNLLMLRDPRTGNPTADELSDLAAKIKDGNYRIFVSEEQIHILNRQIHFQADSPYEIWQQLLQSNPENLDPSHAFYLGFEMAKALTALTLGKDYHQDQALRWGFLTREENSHRVKLDSTVPPGQQGESK